MIEVEAFTAASACGEREPASESGPVEQANDASAADGQRMALGVPGHEKAARTGHVQRFDDLTSAEIANLYDPGKIGCHRDQRLGGMQSDYHVVRKFIRREAGFFAGIQIVKDYCPISVSNGDLRPAGMKIDPDHACVAQDLSRLILVELPDL